MPEKLCRRCKERKPLELFHRWKLSKDGRADWCKACKSSYQQENRDNELKRIREWRANNLERHTAGVKKWQAENPEKKRLIGRNASHRRRLVLVKGNVTFDAWNDRIAEFNGHCAYCLQPSDSLEMDHMLALSRGGEHTIENIVPACRRCNARKSHRTPLEFLQQQIATLPQAA